MLRLFKTAKQIKLDRRTLIYPMTDTFSVSIKNIDSKENTVDFLRNQSREQSFVEILLNPENKKIEKGAYYDLGAGISFPISLEEAKAFEVLSQERIKFYFDVNQRKDIANFELLRDKTNAKFEVLKAQVKAVKAITEAKENREQVASNIAIETEKFEKKIACTVEKTVSELLLKHGLNKKPIDETLQKEELSFEMSGFKI